MHRHRQTRQHRSCLVGSLPLIQLLLLRVPTVQLLNGWSDKATHIPPLKTTSVQELLELSGSIVRRSKLSSYFLAPLLRRLIGSISTISWNIAVTIGELTKHKHRQNRMLEQGSDLEEDGPHERIFPILGDLSMKYPYPVHQLGIMSRPAELTMHRYQWSKPFDRSCYCRKLL